MDLILRPIANEPSPEDCATEFPLVTLSNNGQQLPLTPYNCKQAIWQLCDEYASLVGENDLQTVLQELIAANPKE